MDFFEAQARAKKRTSYLVFLFALAVLGTILAGYLLAWFVVHSDEPNPPLLDWPVLGGVAAVTLLIVTTASTFKWFSFRAGGRAVAESVGARRVQAGQASLPEQRLLNVVEEMAIASGVPMPAVYVLDNESAINAFAAGLTTHDAVVAVTKGTLERLTRDELQGVIGHEFSHILNGDMRLNIKLTATIFGILVIALIGRGLLWSLRGVRVRSSKGGKDAAGMMALIVGIGLALLVIGYIGYFFGRLIQAAISRQREFLADASAVQFTRNPSGIVGALKKIGGLPAGSSLETHKATAIGHFFFAQGFRSQFGGLWATHPPLQERIRAIDPSQETSPSAAAPSTPAASPAPLPSGSSAKAPRGASGFSGGTSPSPSAPPPLPRATVAQSITTVGTLTAGQIAGAQSLLARLAPGLHEAARTPQSAPALIYALLLDTHSAIRERQRALITENDGPNALAEVDKLAESLRTLHVEQRLPLVQLALAPLRELGPAERRAFLRTLPRLADADGQLSVFEFALQKLVTHSLELGQNPSEARAQPSSFKALAGAIATTLSVLARVSADEDASASKAFTAGADQLPQIAADLRFANDARLTDLDTALDAIAAASLIIRRRTLIAAAHVVGADGQVRLEEAELLRTLAAVFDCPMPPIG